jgi:hypothetical protein
VAFDLAKQAERHWQDSAPTLSLVLVGFPGEANVTKCSLCRGSGWLLLKETKGCE